MKLTRKKRRWGPLLALVILLLVVGLVAAAGEMMPRSLVSSGGGQVSAPADEGSVTLHSAVGQPATGAVQNELVLCSGYLCAAGAPVAPVAESWELFLPAVLDQRLKVASPAPGVERVDE